MSHVSIDCSAAVACLGGLRGFPLGHPFLFFFLTSWKSSESTEVVDSVPASLNSHSPSFLTSSGFTPGGICSRERDEGPEMSPGVIIGGGIVDGEAVGPSVLLPPLIGGGLFVPPSNFEGRFGGAVTPSTGFTPSLGRGGAPVEPRKVYIGGDGSVWTAISTVEPFFGADCPAALA